MKIEIGESLFLSWLRHVKECQLVQTNWKASRHWKFQNRDTLERLMHNSNNHFQEKHNYTIYKKTSNLDQLMMQAEIDVLGMHTSTDIDVIYAIDVAFHESGLNYGSRPETVSRVIKKYLRTAMCLHGYFGKKTGTIVFASPKIIPCVYKELNDCLPDIRDVLEKEDLRFSIRLIANQDFSSKILNPILKSLESVADTAELFIRSIQLFNLFSDTQETPLSPHCTDEKEQTCYAQIKHSTRTDYHEMKIGVIVRTVLKEILSKNTIPPGEIANLQNKDYSKKNFGLQFPLLRKANNNSLEKIARYYAEAININDEYYFICSEWYAQSKGLLLLWINKYSRQANL